jgi:iron(III) transport system substrate-binding protein
MKNIMKLASIALVLLFTLFGLTNKASAAKLTLYCSVEIDVCEMLEQAYEKETGTKVAMTRASSGETFAKIKAESSNPKGDVWFGGTGDPHLTAAQENLTAEYKSKHFNDLLPAAQNQAVNANYKSVGIYVGALGFGYNKELLAKKGLPAPKSWMDLTKPIYKGEIQIANPNSSGTAYTTLATIIQIFGEDKGWDYMKALHMNINTYTKSGSAPIKATGRGENLIGICFQHDGVKQTKKGLPVVTVSPEEGTGYEVGSMSIIAGARNMKEAKKFYDWALSPAIQTMVFTSGKSLQVPSNTKAQADPDAPDLSTINLIDYNFKVYGDKTKRAGLLSKWDNDVSVIPR